MTSPLINTNAYSFLNTELKKANDVNMLYNSLLLNVILFVALLLGTTVMLYYRYENKKKNDYSYEIDKRNALLEKMMRLETFVHKDDNLLTSLPIFTSTL